MNRLTCQFVLCMLVAVCDGRLAGADDPTRLLENGRLPADSRLGKPRDLNAYSPFAPPATREAWEARRKQLREQILVATDFSIQAQKAILLAATLAHQCNATLTLLHVVDANPATASAHAGKAEDLMGQLWQNALNQMVRLKDQLSEQNILTETMIVEGLPWEQIATQSAGFDLLVLGKEPAPSFGNFFSRRTGRRALQHAACPVLTA